MAAASVGVFSSVDASDAAVVPRRARPRRGFGSVSAGASPAESEVLLDRFRKDSHSDSYVVSSIKLWMLQRAATFSARVRKASPVVDPGALATTGAPWSLASRVA